jgi:hypothetical protein
MRTLIEIWACNDAGITGTMARHRNKRAERKNRMDKTSSSLEASLPERKPFTAVTLRAAQSPGTIKSD